MQNNLHIEQIRNRLNEKIPIHVLLAASDCIINPHRVRDYLNEHHVDFYWAKKQSHGAFMYKRDNWEVICSWISQ
jgi:hypothetical protein